MEERGTLLYVKCILGLWARLALACKALVGQGLFSYQMSCSFMNLKRKKRLRGQN